MKHALAFIAVRMTSCTTRCWMKTSRSSSLSAMKGTGRYFACPPVFEASFWTTSKGLAEAERVSEPSSETNRVAGALSGRKASASALIVRPQARPITVSAAWSWASRPRSVRAATMPTLRRARLPRSSAASPPGRTSAASAGVT